MTGLLDILIVVLVVGGAASWLAWRFFGPSRSSASCASGCGKCEEATGRGPDAASADLTRRARSPLRLVSPGRPASGHNSRR